MRINGEGRCILKLSVRCHNSIRRKNTINIIKIKLTRGFYLTNIVGNSQLGQHDNGGYGEKILKFKFLTYLFCRF